MIPGARSRTVSSGGLALAVSEAGDHDHPTVLLVHGYPDTRAVWSQVAPRLADRFHVVAYDVRGAGESGAPDCLAGYDLARLTDDVLAVIEAVAPGRKVHLVGHDWGSIQGWEFATSPRLDGRLASFTSISGPCLDHMAHWIRRRIARRELGVPFNQLRRSWYIWGMAVPGAAELAWKLALGRSWPKRMASVEGIRDGEPPAPTLLRDALHGLGLYRRNFPRRFVRPRADAFARVPVQLIVPLRDRFVSPALFDELEHWAPGVRRHDIDRGHWVLRSDPDAIAGWIGGFARDHEKAAS